MLESVEAYLNGYYPLATDSELYARMVYQLTQAIQETSVASVTRTIRDAGLSCPKIVKQVDTGQYTFLKCAKKVILDFDEAFVSAEGYSHGFYGFYRTHEHIRNIPLMVGYDHPVYFGEYLHRWISYGAECEGCGTPFIDRNDEGLCSVCGQQGKLLEHRAKAEEILETEDTTSTLFGVELEYEDITAKEVYKCLKGHAISKRDGSIHKGVEIVTRPASVETHKKSLQPFYDAVKVAAKSNTGMHVHVDKSKLSSYMIGFMLEFLNKSSLIPYIEKVAGREYSTNTYCKSSAHMKMSWGNKFDEDKYKLVKTPTQKYSPLNTSKPTTIEVRIFSSPESHEEMCAKLDFVAALVKYSSPYSVSVKSLKDKFIWETFTGFIKANRKEFPHFYNFFLKEEKL